MLEICPWKEISLPFESKVVELAWWPTSSKADIAKPMIGMGPGVFEIALWFRGNAFRVMYAVQIDDDLWVIHAFQKKSKITTPKRGLDLIKERLKRLKEFLQ